MSNRLPLRMKIKLIPKRKCWDLRFFFKCIQISQIQYKFTKGAFSGFPF